VKNENKKETMNKILVVLVTVLLITSCGEKQIRSKWADFEISIDGNVEDWEGKLLYFKDEQAALGVANDSSFLYIALSTRERSSFMQALAGGLMLWFENENADSKKIGINFPIGSSNNSFAMMGKNQNAEKNSEQVINALIRSQNELSIVDEDSYPLVLLGIKNDKNIEAAIGFEKNVFYYELKIPLQKTKKTSYAINAKFSDIISVEIETLQPERPTGGSGRSGMSDGMSGGGRGGGMGGGRGGGRGAGASMNASSFDPIEISFEVVLALPNNTE
jgi:hypothetical protein